MINLSFPTIKLKNYIERVNKRVKDYENPTLKVYGVSNKDGVCITGKKISENLNNYIVIEENYFVYNPYRINVGSIGLVPKGVKGIVSPAYVVFKSKGQINNKLLLQYLKSSVGINLIKWYGNKGGVRDALRYSDLEKIDFPDITKLNQNNIINKLAKLEIINSKLIKDIDSQNEYISSLRQSILQEAVQGKLTADWRKENSNVEPTSELLKRIKVEKEKLIKEKKIKKQKPLEPITEDEIPFELPKDWTWCRLGEICNIETNLVDPFEYLVYPHIAPNNIEKNTGRLLFYNTVQEDNVTSINYLFKAGRILYSKIRPRLNKVIISKFEGLCSADMYPIKAFISNWYLQFFLLSKEYLQQITKSDNRVKMPKTNQNEMNKILFPLPPLQEQEKIVKKVDKLMQLCDELEENVKQAKEYSEQLMEAVLREAFEENINLTD